DVRGPAEIAAVGGAFNRMAERLRRDEAERALMLAGVSHDLRTPLTRLRLCLAMMRCSDDELETTANRQVDRIEAMLEQFLDMARGFAQEPVCDCDLVAVLEAALRDADPEGVVETDLPATLHAALRPVAVARAVGNLLGNALRHGQPGVCLRLERTGEGVVITVRDHGPGFDAASAERLLRPFARGNSARGGDGTGLGLAIVERVALAHGGQVRFAQREGGFEARLHLPYQSRG
ncbi:ATP-binding protein, partial [Novosphingobium sp. 1949]